MYHGYHVCVPICMCKCMCIYLCVYTHTPTHTHIHIPYAIVKLYSWKQDGSFSKKVCEMSLSFTQGILNLYIFINLIGTKCTRLLFLCVFFGYWTLFIGHAYFSLVNSIDVIRFFLIQSWSCLFWFDFFCSRAMKHFSDLYYIIFLFILSFKCLQHF